MLSTVSHSDSDQTYVDMDKGASGAVDSRSRKVAHEFDGHISTFTRAFIKNGSNGAG